MVIAGPPVAIHVPFWVIIVFDDASVGFLPIEVLQIPEIVHVSHCDRFLVAMLEFCQFWSFLYDRHVCADGFCNSRVLAAVLVEVPKSPLQLQFRQCRSLFA